jgi:hypothetical protein
MGTGGRPITVVGFQTFSDVISEAGRQSSSGTWTGELVKAYLKSLSTSPFATSFQSH